MKVPVWPLALTLAMAAIGGVRAEEVIATSCLFEATHFADPSHHLDALYSGSVDANKWEEATASTPIHPGDERWCHWKIQARITRKILAVYKPGVERSLDTLPPTDVWYSVAIYGEGRPYQSCDAAVHRFQSDYVHAESGLTRDFHKVVGGDALNVQRTVRAKFPDTLRVDVERLTICLNH
jgi:hypothetical protein